MVGFLISATTVVAASGTGSGKAQKQDHDIGNTDTAVGTSPTEGTFIIDEATILEAADEFADEFSDAFSDIVNAGKEAILNAIDPIDGT